jgi:hypothetical protein
MDSKQNQIVVGIIAFAVGVLLLMQKSFATYASLLFISVAVAFILLYITKRKSWALIIGMYMAWYAASDILGSFLGDAITFSVSSALFFIVTSLIFFVFYYNKNKTGLLLPASILLWFGIYTILRSLEMLPFYHMSGFLFMLCTGMAFFTAYYLGRGFVGRWALIVGILFVALGCGLSFGYGNIFIGIRNMAALIFIVTSLVLILHAIRKKG